MTDNFVMPVRAIKNIVKKEFSTFYDDIGDKLRWSNDATQNIARYGYNQALEQLDACQSYEALDEFINSYYEMSLEDWINSL